MKARTLPTFVNPFWPDNFPDPFVLKVRSRYYAYATAGTQTPGTTDWVFPILVSDDMVRWHEAGKALRAFGPPYHSYWAPEVTAYNGRFYLYYAVHHGSEFQGAIRVAVAERPEGPFIDSGHDLTSQLVPWAIDPHVLRAQDGQWYLFLTIEYLHDSSGFVGSGNAVVRLVDPFTIEGPLTRVTSPAHAWQLFEAQRQEKGGVDWYTVEGPAVAYHRKRYYEFYSGGCYFRANYAVSYATSPVPMGPEGLQDKSWTDWKGLPQREVLLQGIPEHIIGPGHNSLVLGPNNVDLYMAYHAWNPAMTMRRPFLDRLFWHADELWTAAPTYEPQPRPLKPNLQERFEQPILSASWLQTSGDWYVGKGEVVQNDLTVGEAVLQWQEPLPRDWLLEVHVRLLEGTGSYGLLLHGTTEVLLALTTTQDGHHAFWARLTQDEPLHMQPLATGFEPHAWHALLIRYSGSLLSIELDQVPMVEFVLSNVPDTFALRTEGCSAAFTSITLTQHFRDEFLEAHHTPAFLGWQASDSTTLVDWQVQEGALLQCESTPGIHILTKGETRSDCEIGATIQLRQSAVAEVPAYGLALLGELERLEFCFIRVQRRYKFVVTSDRTPVPFLVEQDLPDEFDVASWHTLRLLLTSQTLQIFLDGPQFLAPLKVPATKWQPGLYTRNASAAFTSVWQTGFAR